VEGDIERIFGVEVSRLDLGSEMIESILTQTEGSSKKRQDLG